MHKWISVKDGLPDTDRCVLVQVSGRPNDRVELVDALQIASYLPEDGWMLEEYPMWIDANPVAWMELPEPYKEES